MSDHLPSDREPLFSDLLREDPSYIDIVLEFVEGLKDRVRDMADAVERGDLERLRTSAHQLKGSGGGHGFPQLSQEAGKLEQFARESQLEQCKTAVEEIRDLCARIVVPQS